MQGQTDVPDLLDVITGTSAEKTCAVFEDRVLSYGELKGKIVALSARLDAVAAAIVVADPIEAMVAWLACYHKRIPCALLEPSVYAQEQEQIAQRMAFGQVISDQDDIKVRACNLVNVRRSESAPWQPPTGNLSAGYFALATSRSTGTLKLVKHAYGDLVNHHATWTKLCPLQDGDLVAASRLLPFGYGFIVAVIWVLWSGKAVSFASERDGQIHVHPACTVSSLPVRDLQRTPALKGLRVAISSGTMIATAGWLWFEEAYPGTRLLNLVGATETLMPFLYSEGPTSFACVPGYRARVVAADGSVCVGKAGLFEVMGPIKPQYLGQSNDTPTIEFNGWCRLGDFAIDNADGTYKFLGRSSISFDLENALRQDKRVRDCHYTIHEGRPALLVEADLLVPMDVSANLASLGVVLSSERIAVLPKLPRTASGKVLAASVELALKENAGVASVDRALDHLPEVAFASVKNMWVRQMFFREAGKREDGHAHPFDHMTLLARGALRVTVRGRTTDFYARDGGKIIYIEKEVEHTLEALEDGTLAYCIHALRGDNQTGDILDPASIPNGANALLDGMAAPLLCADRVRDDKPGLPIHVEYL